MILQVQHLPAEDDPAGTEAVEALSSVFFDAVENFASEHNAGTPPPEVTLTPTQPWRDRANPVTWEGFPAVLPRPPRSASSQEREYRRVAAWCRALWLTAGPGLVRPCRRHGVVLGGLQCRHPGGVRSSIT